MSSNRPSPACSDAERALVLDAAGQALSPCSPDKARRMVAAGKARLLSENPLTIQLPLVADLKSPQAVPAPEKPGTGRRLLLHICCGPCGTYPIQRLRELGFEVTGFWFNPNIHPLSEHERRRECARTYAEEVRLAWIDWGSYEMPAYFRAIAGHEAREERCAICYRLRLQCAAQVATERGFDAFTTTLLISPYQQQVRIHSIGEEIGQTCGVAFYFENLRKGWVERGRLAREHNLYQQQYCGCLYSEWEAAYQRAQRSAASSAGVPSSASSGGVVSPK